MDARRTTPRKMGAPSQRVWTLLVLSVVALSAGPAMAADGVIIDLDGSFFIQLGLVLVLWFVLNQLIFKPYLATQQLRYEKTEQARLQAQELRERAQELQTRHEQGWREGLDAAAQARKVLSTEGAKSREAAIERTRAETRERIEKAQEKLSAQVEQARLDLQQHAEQMAGFVVAKILGREN